jgi:hypothetical protein
MMMRRSIQLLLSFRLLLLGVFHPSPSLACGGFSVLNLNKPFCKPERALPNDETITSSVTMAVQIIIKDRPRHFPGFFPFPPFPRFTLFRGLSEMTKPDFEFTVDKASNATCGKLQDTCFEDELTKSEVGQMAVEELPTMLLS